MLFNQIIGQDDIKARLIKTVKEGRISHAQLFYGPEGSGKLGLAIAYAQYISCEDRQEYDSCGVCPSCLKYNKLVHPDLHFVFPVTTKKSQNPVSDDFIKEWREAVLENHYMDINFWLEKLGAENSQGGIFVHESSQILKKLSLKTFESEYKVMIIWLAEKMNVHAANRLLKILEEPPDKTLFILISDNVGQIIPTIISRTQLVKIPKISDTDLSKVLSERFDLNTEELNDIIRLSGGSYSIASGIIGRNERNLQYLNLFQWFMRYSYGLKLLGDGVSSKDGKPGSINDCIEEIAKLGREKQKEFLQYCIRMIRENYILNTGNPEISFLTMSETDFSRNFYSFIHEGNVDALAMEINKAHYHIERNGYAKLVFTDLALIIHRLLKK